MRPPPRAPTAATAAAAVTLLLATTPVALGAAGALPQTGRYKGTTSDGHIIEFTVERSAKPGFPRKLTHFHVVYDIAGCRSGPVRQPFFASVAFGKTASKRGTFARDVGHSNKPNAVQLRLTGKFTSPTRASGSFRVGVVGRCPIGPSSATLTFTVIRR
jgi:hypothetical protein